MRALEGDARFPMLLCKFFLIILAYLFLSFFVCLFLDFFCTHILARQFHCVGCPSTYCFDCLPDEYSAQAPSNELHKQVAEKLERQGVGTKSYLFFSCSDSCTNEVESSESDSVVVVRMMTGAHDPMEDMTMKTHIVSASSNDCIAAYTSFSLG
jgi:hypothetical protein